MAANVDSPKRRSLRSQGVIVAADNGPASATSELRGPAGSGTSSNAKRLSAEKRRGTTKKQEGSLDKRSAERLRKHDDVNGSSHEENENGGYKAKGKRNSAKHVHSMEPNTESGDTSQSPGGDHTKNIRPRRNHDNGGNAEDSSGEVVVFTATKTRSSRGKIQDLPEAYIVVGGQSEDVTSSKIKKDKTGLAEAAFEKEQGSEGDGGTGGRDRSLRPRRSRNRSNGTGENSPGGAINSSVGRETRSGKTKNCEQSGSSHHVGGLGEGANTSMEQMGNAHLAETDSQEAIHSGHPGESRGPDKCLQSGRSRGGSSFNAEDSQKGAASSTVTNTSFSRKTRSSKAKQLEEPAISTVIEGDGDRKRPTLSETNSPKKDGFEDPGGCRGDNRHLQPSRNIIKNNGNAEDSSREAASSNEINTSFSRETISSRAEDYVEPGASAAVRGKGEHVGSSKEKKENAHLGDANSQEGSEGLGRSSRHNRSLQQQRSHGGSRRKEREARSPTERSNLVREEIRSSLENEAGLSTASKRNSDKGESITVPRGKNREPLDFSHSGRSPSKNVRSISHDGAGIRGGNAEAIQGKSEPVIQSVELLGKPGVSNSPRKNVGTNRNVESTVRKSPPNLPAESNAEETLRDYKVHCCSKQLLQEVLGMCTGICKDILDGQQYLNEEQKQQHHKNFVWDFETAFQENVSINGLSWHEAPDKDSEPDIKILEDQLDEAMVETSMKRKRYPRKILSHFVKTLKTEREILNQFKPVMNPEKVALDPTFELRMKDLSSTAAIVSQHIHETKKALPVQLEKAEGFSQVLSLQPVLEKSHIRKDIFNSRVVIEDISKSAPRVLEITPTESESQDLATPIRSLRKRKASLPQRHLYPLQSKRKISLES